MGWNNGKHISKILRSRYSQQRFDHAKLSATDALKTSLKRVIHKIAEAASNLIKLLIKLQVPKTSLQNDSKTKEELLREKYISPELRQKLLML